MNTPVKPSDVVSAQANPRAVPGDNKPPPYDVEIFAKLCADAQEYADAGGEWLDLERIETEEQAQYLADYIAGARKKLKEIEAWRVGAKRPHDEAAKSVQAAAARPKGTIEESIKKGLDLITPYQQEKKRKADEQARREREEAERQRQEAERLSREAAARNDIAGEVEAARLAKEAEASAKAAARPTSGSVGSASGGGKTIALVEVRSAKITNLMHVFMFFRERPEVLDVLQRLANGYVRAKGFDGKDVPGTNTITTEKAR